MDLLSPVAEYFDVSVGQLTFFGTQVTSLLVAVFFRKQLSPSTTSCATRHLFGAAVGLMLLYWCFGWSLLHMVAHTLGVYAILTLLPSHINHRVAFMFAMGYMLYVQIRRLLDVDNRHILEISYPMMMSTQKLTSLAFSIHDGVHEKRESLRPFQQKYALSKYPSLVEVIGYTFHFAGIICGPTFFFKDYMEFISGDNFECNDNVIVSDGNGDVQNDIHKSNAGKLHKQPDPTRDVLKKLLTSTVCLLIYVLIGARYPTEQNGEMSFINSHGFLYRFFYLNASMLLIRYKYFFAWVMGETIQNAAGLGLHYVDGKPQWDLTTNVNIRKLDMATSLKEITDNWNICTSKWLRLVSYERAGKYRLLLTYVLNALWHGIEPGYYMTFLTAVLGTLAARRVRKHIRPYFVDTKWKIWYDIVTGVTATTSVCYAMVGFHVLHVRQTYDFFMYSMCWWMHIICICLIVMPMPTPKAKAKSS